MGLTAEQKRMRMEGIGASEIAAVAGLDPYRGPMDVYLRKRGLTTETEAETDAQARGNWLEPILADWYAKERHCEIAAGHTCRSAAHPWALATPDFLTDQVDGPEHFPGDGLEVLLECKTAGLRQVHKWGEPGTDEVSESYLLQVQWQMAVTGARRVDVVVYLATQALPSIYEVRADPALQAGLLSIGDRFWREHVEPGVPPPLDGSEGAREWLRQTYPRHVSKIRQATPEEVEIAERYRDIYNRAAEAEHEKDEAKAKLSAIIGESEGIEWAAGRITWKAPKPTARVAWEDLARSLGATAEQIRKFTTEAASSRRFLAKFSEREE